MTTQKFSVFWKMEQWSCGQVAGLPPQGSWDKVH